jgi:hypothetical protein
MKFRRAWRTAGIPLMVVAALQAGCGSVPDRMLKDYRAAALTSNTSGESLALIAALKAGSNNLPAVPAECFSAPVPTASHDTCTQARNQVVAALLIASERLCIEHRSTIYGNEAVANVALGSLTNFFTGAAAVSTVEKSKTLLAALGLFSNSERSLINEEVYKTIIAPAIDTKIVQTRSSLLLQLRRTGQGSIAAYGFHEAIHDVEAYHNACSFMDGLRLALLEGAQSPDIQREARLRTKLGVLSADMNLIPAADRVSTRKGEYEQLLARYQAVSAEIKALETK